VNLLKRGCSCRGGGLQKEKGKNFAACEGEMLVLVREPVQTAKQEEEYAYYAEGGGSGYGEYGCVFGEGGEMRG